MYTGTGDANTDVGAHLMGFASGFAGGTLLVRFIDAFSSHRLQLLYGGAALAILVVAWSFALIG
jgi:hypothetical protein